MQDICILAVPYELGRLRDGVGLGAEALLDSGAEAALASAGARVETELIGLDDRYGKTGKGDIDASFALIRSVADGVRRAREAGAFPVVLGGSCFLAVGVVAGVDEPRPAVLYLDAHADFNHPDTATSGYFDGCGLTLLTGGAWHGMLATVPGFRPVPETRVVLAGARALDPPEEVRLQASQIVQLPADRLHSPEPLLDALGALDPPPSGLYLHLDLDVLDATVAGVNLYSVPGGIDGDELDGVVAAVIARFPVAGVSLTCYDPTFDQAGRVPPIALRVLRTIAAGV